MKKKNKDETSQISLRRFFNFFFVVAPRFFLGLKREEVKNMIGFL